MARAGVARQRMYSRRGLGPQPRDLGVRPPGAPRAGQEQRPYVPCSWERGPTFCNSARAQLVAIFTVKIFPNTDPDPTRNKRRYSQARV